MELFNQFQGLYFQLFIALTVFSIGVIGFLIRRNLLIMLMCLELMLNGVNITLVSFSKLHQDPGGSVLVLFIILVAAAEAAVGLALIVSLFRRFKNIQVDNLREQKN